MASFYVGSDKADASILAGALNALKGRPSLKDYNELAQLVNELKDVTESRPIPYNIFVNEEERISYEKGEIFQGSCVVDNDRIFARNPKHVQGLAVARLNGRLEKHLFVAEITVSRKGDLYIRWDARSAVGEYAHIAIRLAEFGHLWRVRQCMYCDKWFVAERKKKRFCSDACVKLDWQGSETGKMSRREYMRKYMQKYRRESV